MEPPEIYDKIADNILKYSDFQSEHSPASESKSVANQPLNLSLIIPIYFEQ